MSGSRVTTVTIALLALAACSVPASSPGPAQPAKVAAAPDTQSAKVNLDEIFPPGRGRELLLNNCTTCHTFVPIVVLRMTKEAWERNSRDHRGRVDALSDADFKILYQYLKENFNPDKPVPKLPKELLATWTSY
jgi:mono/diheme cytochrome c family protein